MEHQISVMNFVVVQLLLIVVTEQLRTEKHVMMVITQIQILVPISVQLQYVETDLFSPVKFVMIRIQIIPIDATYVSLQQTEHVEILMAMIYMTLIMVETD